jgi:hypothetical protein
MMTQVQKQRLRDDIDAGCYDHLLCLCEIWEETKSLLIRMGMDDFETQLLERLCCRATEEPEGDSETIPTSGETQPTPGGSSPSPTTPPIPGKPSAICAELPAAEVFESI